MLLFRCHCLNSNFQFKTNLIRSEFESNYRSFNGIRRAVRCICFLWVKFVLTNKQGVRYLPTLLVLLMYLLCQLRGRMRQALARLETGVLNAIHSALDGNAGNATSLQESQRNDSKARMSIWLPLKNSQKGSEAIDQIWTGLNIAKSFSLIKFSVTC